MLFPIRSKFLADSGRPKPTLEFGVTCSRSLYLCGFLEFWAKEKPLKNFSFSRANTAYVRRFELPTPWSVAKCSIQLSYTHVSTFRSMPATGIEPVLCHHNRILSPARLPVPPRGHVHYKVCTMGPIGLEPMTLCL